MHWHPNADEWQYYIAGQATMTVFNTGPKAVTQNFKPDGSLCSEGIRHTVTDRIRVSLATNVSPHAIPRTSSPEAVESDVSMPTDSGLQATWMRPWAGPATRRHDIAALSSATQSRAGGRRPRLIA